MYLHTAPAKRRLLVPQICARIRAAADLEVLRITELDGARVKSSWVSVATEKSGPAALGTAPALFLTDILYGEGMEEEIESVSISDEVFHHFDVITNRDEFIGAVEMYGARGLGPFEPETLEMITTLTRLILTMLG